MTLKELAIEHDYYCSPENYHSEDAGMDFPTWKVYKEFHDADINMNLVFRFDFYLIDDSDESSGYEMKIFMIKQRKGIFAPYSIGKVEEKDVPEIVNFLKQNFEKLKKNTCNLARYMQDLHYAPYRPIDSQSAPIRMVSCRFGFVYRSGVRDRYRWFSPKTKTNGRKGGLGKNQILF